MKKWYIAILLLITVLVAVVYAERREFPRTNRNGTIGETNMIWRQLYVEQIDVLNEDSTTNAVVDVLELSTSSTGTVAAGLGVGVTFDVEDLGGLEEQGSIDLVSTTVTDGAEDFDFVFKQNDNGTLRETLNIIADHDAGSLTATRYELNSPTSELDGEVTTTQYKLVTSGTEAAGLGMTHEWHMLDAGGSQVQAELGVVFTDVTNGGEDVDLTWRQMIAGTLTDTWVLDADGGGKLIGGEGASVVFSLEADESDDAADTWTFTVADAGAMTIANGGTATMTINETVAFGSSTNIADQVVTDAATFTITAAMSGKILVIGDLTQNTTIDLPAEADGLNYEFWYIGGATEAHDHTIDSENDTNFYIGGLQHVDSDEPGSGSTLVPVYSDGDSNSKLTLNNLEAGSKVKVTCDGTNWYVTGVVYSDTAPAFTDQ